jgi:hypothetical protein
VGTGIVLVIVEYAVCMSTKFSRQENKWTACVACYMQNLFM